jgi:DNA invertase Pin-like site-specific DNA recombinase
MLIFHVMGALAEFERALISERTRAGMAAARARGALIGRPPKLLEQEVMQARLEIAAGAASVVELAQILGVSRLTLDRALKRLDAAA